MGRPRNNAGWEIVRNHFAERGAAWCVNESGMSEGQVYSIARQLGIKYVGRPEDKREVPENVRRFWERWDAGYRPRSPNATT